MARSKGSGCVTFAVIGGVGLMFLLSRRGGEEPPRLTASSNRTEGVAVCLLIDVSGSMKETVNNAEGKPEAKLAIAKRAAIAVCQAVAKYADEDKTRTIRLSVSSFSSDVSLIVPMGKPDPAYAETAINSLSIKGSTAIGDAVIAAQKTLDDTHLKRQHIIVLTDGDNTTGASPEKVADGINALPEELRPSMYVVAFDVGAEVFAGVKGKGWSVYSAADGQQLTKQLDEVVGGHILVEK